MKKTVCILLLLSIILTLCSCSMYGLDEQAESTAAQAPNIVIIQDTTAPIKENNTAQPDVTVAAPSQTAPAAPVTNAQTPDTDNSASPEQTTAAVKAYYTDDPNNKYIATIADRYGLDRGCLIAFVRKNSDTPGATVLQFKGNRDANGNLITTSDELLYVYDIQDNGTVLKTNRDGTDVEGMPQLAGKAAFALVEKYIMPDIEKFKRENRLDG